MQSWIVGEGRRWTGRVPGRVRQTQSLRTPCPRSARMRWLPQTAVSASVQQHAQPLLATKEPLRLPSLDPALLLSQSMEPQSMEPADARGETR